ncbi:MAG: transglycosylase SLT domain-containing protein [bacterium]|jgi:Rod binding domain-containing protein
MALTGIVNGVEKALTASRAGLADRAAKGSPSKAVRKITDEHEIAKARKACQDFEAIFIHKMLESMRAAFESQNEEDEDFGGDLFKSMMDEQLGVALARAGGIGLADILGESLGVEDDEARSAAGSPLAFPTEVGLRAYEESRTLEGVDYYGPAIRAAASDSGVSENLIKAVILQESGGDPRAISSRGAKGLMQLMDATAEELGVRNSFNPVENISAGARYLGDLLREFKGDLELALASYNAGIGAVRKFGGVPPYRETQDYVKSVMARLDKLNRASGG